MKTELDYVPGSSIIPIGAFGISPSQLYTFFDKPHMWYRSEILGENTFNGSTSTMLGTIVHFIAKEYVKTKQVRTEEIYRYLLVNLCPSLADTDDTYKLLDKALDNREQIEEYIVENNEREDIDASFILAQFRPMGNALMQNLRTNPRPNRSEELIKAEIIPNVYACGSCDAVIGDREIVDYKTTSDTSPKDYIPYNYKLQLLTYAYIYKQMGLDIDRITIIWITQEQINRGLGKNGRPLKDYPVIVSRVSESISKQDFEFIESLLKLVAETIVADQQHPELRHIIWRDYRLKQ